jgi:GNAT superfamily N-acetyltransferase
MIVLPEDAPEGEEREKAAAALARCTIEEARDAAGFDEGYAALDAEFGPKGELERREVLAMWFAGPRTPPEGWAPWIGCRYHLLLARSRGAGGGLAGVRDCFVALDAGAGRCVVILSHAVVLPPYRRSGVATLLRAAPAALARRTGAAEITLFAEMEPVAPEDPATVVRLIAYGKAGFWAIPPAVLPYAQPDFRDVAALGVEAVPLPLIPIVRQVGEEARGEIPRARVEACLRHVHAVHSCDSRLDDIVAIREHVRRALGAHAGEVVPLLRLPRSPDAIETLAPLLRSAVLPHYPAAWRRVGAIGDPAEERAALLAAWSRIS